MCFQDIKYFCVDHYLIVTIWMVLFFIAFFLMIKSWLMRYFMVSCGKAVQLINKDNAMVIDLRNCDDYHRGHIIRSINLSYIDVKQGNYRSVFKIHGPLIVVCDSGSLSYNLVKYLSKVGFKRVYFLQDGVNGWVSNNLPLVKND